ncbi:MAG TPA: hypothetical protein VLQ79_08430 [Myxococcaceae bacterium]|nr:hypothetical protein [Myxococcaceae bacterium]
MKFVDTSSHGFLTLGFDAAKARATFTLIPASEVTVDDSKHPAGTLQGKVRTQIFDIAGAVLTAI